MIMARLPAKPVEPSAKPAIQLRVFGNKPFMRWAGKFGASNKSLWGAAQVEPDANLGGGVFKFRLAREGQGSSGGARLIVAMKQAERIVMMFAFEKKDLSNINVKELKGFRKLAKIYLERTEAEMNKLVKDGELIEIKAPPAEEPAKQGRA
jgi:hypothetical protein